MKSEISVIMYFEKFKCILNKILICFLNAFLIAFLKLSLVSKIQISSIVKGFLNPSQSCINGLDKSNFFNLLLSKESNQLPKLKLCCDTLHQTKPSRKNKTGIGIYLNR